MGAVESQWGGFMGKEKAEFLRTHIYAQFGYSKAKASNTNSNSNAGNGAAMDQYDLEDALAIYMEEEYSIVLEDDSERQVALCIVQMYELCGRGDFSLSRGTIQKANEATAAAGAKGTGKNGGTKAVVQTDGELDE